MNEDLVEKSKDISELRNIVYKECEEYRKLETIHLQRGPEPKYSKDSYDIGLLEEHDVDVSKYITNQDEIDAHDEKYGNLVSDHTKTCEKQCCKDIHNWQVDNHAVGHEVKRD